MGPHRPGGTEINRYLWLLRQRAFFSLYMGQTISRLGDGIAQIIITWTVWESTNSPWLVGLALIFQTVPPVLLGFAAGVAADRYPHRNVMIASDVARMAVTLAVAIIGWTVGLTHWHLMVTGFLLVTGSTFFGPARSAIVPSLVPRDRVEAANGLLSGSFHGALLIGPLLGGWLLGFTGVATLIFLDSLTFAISLATLLALPGNTRSADGPRRSVFVQARDGVATVWDNPSLLWVVGTFGVGTFLAGGVFQVGKTLLMDHIGAGAAGLGLYSTVSGVGLMLGSFLCGRKTVQYKARVVMLAWAADGLLLALLGLSPNLWVALALGLLGGIANAYINVPTESLIQLHGGENTGKVFSYWMITIWLGETVSLAFFSPLFSRMPLPAMWGFTGLGLALLALLALRWVWSLTDGDNRARSRKPSAEAAW